ncbi:MAG: lysylphosphatidylglycerol synthase transmembrane domain-containing protein [Flammeovirgaceae bacterium]
MAIKAIWEKHKSIIKFILKVVLTVLALWFVFQKLDFNEILGTLKQIHLGYFFIAFLLYNLSKVISAYRLLLYYRTLGLQLAWWYHLRLYYLGMFYNLFLPGGIGGDGYKVIILKQVYPGKTRNLVSATLLDRISGLAALVFLGLGLGYFTPLMTVHVAIPPLTIIALIILYPAFFIFNSSLFKSLLKVFVPTSVLSVGVQGTQVIAGIFLLMALGVETNWLAYLALLLVANAASVLPLTVGGFGLREFVFIHAYPLLDLDKNYAITFSMLFFILTALSSLLGIIYSIRKEEPKLQTA